MVSTAAAQVDWSLLSAWILAGRWILTVTLSSSDMACPAKKITAGEGNCPAGTFSLPVNASHNAMNSEKFRDLVLYAACGGHFNERLTKIDHRSC